MDRRKANINYQLSKKYSDMKKRAKEKGLAICSKAEFMSFAMSDGTFKRLLQEWIKSDFDTKLTPSIDRMDNSKGYEVGNMQFITHSRNVIKGNSETPKVGHVPTRKRRVQIVKENQLYTFETCAAACDFLGVARTAVHMAIKNNRRIKGWQPSFV